MENCLEVENDVDLIAIAKEQMWGLSQDVLYRFIDDMNDYAIPDNQSFLIFSEKCQEVFRNLDAYS